MAKSYRTAQGKKIDMGNLQAQNEGVIAVGNQKVNARGDLLGPGGKVIKTRDQVMKEYYSLNTPVATEPSDTIISTPPQQPIAQPTPRTNTLIADKPEPKVEKVEPVVIHPDSGLDEVDTGPEVPSELVSGLGFASVPPAPPTNPLPPAVQAYTKATESTDTPIRGSLAGAIAKTATVSQKAHLPPKKAKGVIKF